MTDLEQKSTREVPSEPPTIDYATVDALYKELHSYRKVADLLQTNYAKVYRAHHAVPLNGDVPAVYQGETGGLPERVHSIPGIPVIPEGIPDGPWREAIESRLDVIESFIAAAQQRTHGIPGLPESIPGIPERLTALPLPTGAPPPTKKHSFVIALDLLDAINDYAAAHHLEIKSVLDLALRRFFAGEGER